MQKKKSFFIEALRSIKTSGTIAPSSKYLTSKMLKQIDFSNATIVVELGSGDGVVTKQILKRLHAKAQLFIFEINPNFIEKLQHIKHEQLTIIQASAENIEDELKKRNITKVDAVVSCLPLSVIPKKIAVCILEETYKTLKIGGKFIQFQYSTQFFRIVKNIFKNAKLSFEFRNLPPAFIYTCVKKHKK